MNDLLAKISSYNIFNYLFPGALLVVVAERMGIVALPQQLDIITRLLIYYSAGLGISRVGSLILEPALLWTGFVKYSEYSDYVTACDADPKIVTLVEASNTFRTIAAGALCLLVAWPLSSMAQKGVIAPTTGTLLSLALVLVVFLASFKKQVGYVKKRVARRCPPTGSNPADRPRAKPSRKAGD